MWENTVTEALFRNGMTADTRQITLLSRYLEEMLTVNEQMNLTAIRDPGEASVKHIADCCACLPYLTEGNRLIDIGSGAGLPAFPFAIMRPDWQITALDSTGKKVRFIAETAEKIGVPNLRAVCARAEEFGHLPQVREQYDMVSARAVARLNILCELCLPFLRIGGLFAAMKSRLCDEELSECTRVLSVMGGKTEKIHRFSLNGSAGEQERTIILIRKIAQTPKKYPRAYAQIAKKPL